MALTWVWVGMVCMALVYGAATGQSAAVGAAAAQGVQQAVSFCLTVGGMICLWSGVMEVMRRSGIAAGLSRLLQPVLRRLFPHASRDAQTLDRQRIFRTHIDVAVMRFGGNARNHHAFDYFVRIALHNGTVHKCTGVALVAVTNYIFWIFLLLGTGSPFFTAKEAAASSASKI